VALDASRIISARPIVPVERLALRTLALIARDAGWCDVFSHLSLPYC
jgi:hypothetical protein